MKTLENLSFLEYIELAKCTAMVNIENHLYYVIGIVGEAQEYVDEESSEELGDIYWYFGQLLRSLEINFQFHLQEVGPAFGQGQDLVARAIYISQLCKKLQRHIEFKDYDFSGEKWSKLHTHLKNFAKSLKTECRHLGVSEADVFKENLVKLYDRHEEMTGTNYYDLNDVIREPIFVEKDGDLIDISNVKPGKTFTTMSNKDLEELSNKDLEEGIGDDE